MLRIPLPKLRKRSRKYPIKRDEFGRSARRRAFEAFDRGKRLGEVAQLVGISPQTVYRYFADWKKLRHHLELDYRMMKIVRKSNRDFSQKTVDLLSTYLEMSEEEVIERFEKPWGLKQLMMGKWPNYHQEREQSEAEFRLRAALGLINFIESRGVPPEKILDQLLKMKT
jgi:AcrR family transcriptional regulator